MHNELKPLREGIVVTMHDGVCEYEVQCCGRGVEDLDVLLSKARVHCDNKPWQIGINHDYNMAFSISSVFESRAKNSTKTKHIYNESANLIHGWNVV